MSVLLWDLTTLFEGSGDTIEFEKLEQVLTELKTHELVGKGELIFWEKEFNILLLDRVG